VEQVDESITRLEMRLQNNSINMLFPKATNRLLNSLVFIF
jgi:hypothetical protein